MASIGELTATVRADIAGYVGPMRQVAATNAQVANGMQDTARTATGVVRPLNQLRGALFDVAAGALGLRGKLSNAAEGLLLFGGGGAAVIAATAGLALLGQAFTKWRETVEREAQQAEDTWTRTLDRMVNRNPFTQLINERVEAVNRLNAAQERLTALETPTSAGYDILSGRQRQRGASAEDIANARLEVDRAKKALDDVNRAIEEQRTAIRENRLDELADGAREAAKYQRELADSTRGFSAQAFDLYGGDILTNAVTQLQKQLDVQRQLKVEIEATTEAQGRALRAAVDKAGMSDTKSRARERLAAISDSARDAASGLARGFLDAFSEQEGTLASRMASVLRSAMRSAVEKLLAEKIFGPIIGELLGAFTGGFTKLFSGGEGASAPSAAGAVPSAGAIVVPLNDLPPARSPVEMARDQMHQAVWVETARVALQNGVNLQPRFR